MAWQEAPRRKPPKRISATYRAILDHRGASGIAQQSRKPLRNAPPIQLCPTHQQQQRTPKSTRFQGESTTYVAANKPPPQTQPNKRTAESNAEHIDSFVRPSCRVSPGRVGVNFAEIIYRRRVDIEAAADVDRLHVGPQSHDVLQGQVCQLSAVPEVEPLDQRAPAQEGFDGRVSDVETCRQVNALATTMFTKKHHETERKAGNTKDRASGVGKGSQMYTYFQSRKPARSIPRERTSPSYYNGGPAALVFSPETHPGEHKPTQRRNSHASFSFHLLNLHALCSFRGPARGMAPSLAAIHGYELLGNARGTHEPQQTSPAASDTACSACPG